MCENEATCVSVAEEDGDYKCLCPEGFTGRNCEVDKHVSAPFPQFLFGSFNSGFKFAMVQFYLF